MIPVLTTSRLTLRAPTPEDFPVFAEFYASDRSRHVGGPMTREQAWRALAKELGHWPLRGYGRWAVEITETGAFIGIIGLWNPLDWPEPEIGWDLMNGFEGHGYATEAAEAARAHAYDVLGWPTAISLVAVANDGSRKVAQRLGATRDGTFHHDHFGTMEIWRHPAPVDLSDGGMEAYA